MVNEIMIGAMLPKEITVDRERHLIVGGKPFFILGGQVHNSSAFTRQTMDPCWDVLVQMNANTAEVPVYWEQVELSEGNFDFAIIDDLLNGARGHGLKLVLLWFATWKNGTMKYAPRWVKAQPERFQRVITAEGLPLPVLSPHCAATLAADSRAFQALLAYIKDRDQDQQTVIAVQVENEPGSQGSPRDYSADAELAFNGDVPAEVMEILPGATRPALRKAWQEMGSPVKGTWSAVFGRRAAEVFNAWHIARYIDQIAAAGKEVYQVPLYVNVWLGEIAFRQAGYDYPSGGAVSDMLDIWKAAAPHLDLLAPDIYISDSAGFRQICANYDRPDNPLFIPECGPWPATARQMFYAIADHRAIGISPFGIDDFFDAQGVVAERAAAVVDSFKAIRAILPLIPRYQDAGKIHAIVQEEGMTSQYIELDGYVALVQFGRTWFGQPLPDGGAAQTTRGRGLLIQAGPKEFYATGIGFTVYIRPVDASQVHSFLKKDLFQGRFDPWLFVETGHFEGDQWIIDGTRGGDETDFGLMMHVPGQAVHAIFD